MGEDVMTTTARHLDSNTRKFLGQLRAIVAAPDRERRKWLKECDRLLARPALRRHKPKS
jgi:hypothetical protein